ncbi:MAG: TatD family hydrolase [Spirochaetales bacterium]|nr:TatD family hydrolase [Spirochaetales bacterium]
MKLFDTHSHLSLIHDDHIEQLLLAQEAKRENVLGILSITNNIQDFFTVHENLKTASNVFFAIGVSPSEVLHPGRDWEQKIIQGRSLERVIAIGETGLDYEKKYGDKKSQIDLFLRQLDLAARLNLPVVIHNRGAGDDLLSILKDKIPPRGAILHCYSEDVSFAQKVLDLNVWISFAGNVTYRNARQIQETAAGMPIERMLIETESPFMIPSEHRGKRNKPSYLPSTLYHIADLRDEDPEYVAEQLWLNSLEVFGLTDKLA